MTVAPRALAHWQRMQADAASRRMNQHLMSRRDGKCPANEILGRHSFQHHTGRLLVGDRLGQLDETIGREGPFDAIAADASGIGDAVTDPEVPHALADGGDLSRPLGPDDERQAAGRRIEAGAIVGIDEVDATGVVPDDDLACLHGGSRDVLEVQDLRSTRLVDDDSSRHVRIPSVLSPSQNEVPWALSFARRFLARTLIVSTTAAKAIAK